MTDLIGNAEIAAMKWVSAAIHEVYAVQPELWSWDLGERTRVAEIFVVLRATDPFDRKWQVDLEWNREGDQGTPKQLTPDASNKGTPDVVVHRRGLSGPGDNLLVAEFKNAGTGGAIDEADQDKVEKWMKRFNYQFGAVIALGPSGGVFDPSARWLYHQADGSIGHYAWRP